jgi:hypothetical protein
VSATEFVWRHYHISDNICSVGQIVGMGVGPFISDWMGRKVAMWGLAVALVVAAVLEIAAREWRGYAVAKLFAGRFRHGSQSFQGDGAETDVSVSQALAQVWCRAA